MLFPNLTGAEGSIRQGASQSTQLLWCLERLTARRPGRLAVFSAPPLPVLPVPPRRPESTLTTGPQLYLAVPRAH